MNECLYKILYIFFVVYLHLFIINYQNSNMILVHKCWLFEILFIDNVLHAQRCYNTTDKYAYITNNITFFIVQLTNKQYIN